jgi:Cys-rich repeat protein
MTFVSYRMPSHRFSFRPASACLLGLILAAGCGDATGDDDTETGSTTASTSGDGDETGGEGGELNGECSLAERVGLFSVVHEEGYSSVDGEINDAVVPTAVLEETMTEGACKLMQRENPFCDPPCAAGEVCTQDGSCVAYPMRQETGTVTIAGIGTLDNPDGPLVMEAKEDLRYWDTSLPHPAFEPGAVIRLTSTGGQVGALDLDGRGFAPIVVSDTEWVIEEGQDLTVNWEPDEASGASFYLTINIDQHGNSPSTLVCEGPDNGTMVVPTSIIEALLASGISGFPMGHAYRRTVDSMQAGGGCIEFQVRSHVGASVDVAGSTPCTSDMDCPDGQTCDTMNQICV